MNHFYLLIVACTLVYLFMMQLSGLNVGMTFWGVWLLILGLAILALKFIIILRHKYRREMEAKKKADQILKSRI